MPRNSEIRKRLLHGIPEADADSAGRAVVLAEDQLDAFRRVRWIIIAVAAQALVLAWTLTGDDRALTVAFAIPGLVIAGAGWWLTQRRWNRRVAAALRENEQLAASGSRASSPDA
jgi:hypothetical protein